MVENARRINNLLVSKLKPNCCLKALIIKLIVKLKLRYFAYIMWEKESLERYLEKSNIIEKELAENKLARYYC